MNDLPPPVEAQSTNRSRNVFLTIMAIALVMVIALIVAARLATPSQSITEGESFPALTPSPNTTEVTCTQEYAPVCGIDNITYSNRCAAEQQAQVPVAHEGECTE